MNILELPDASLCVRLAATMGHFLWQGAAVYLLVILAGLLFRRFTAGARYAVFAAALLVMAACPPVTFVLLRSPETPAISGGQSPPYVRPEVETPLAFLGGQSPPYPGGDSPTYAVGSWLQAAPVAAEPVSLAVPDEPAVEAIDWWRYAPWLVVCYLGGAALMLARLLLGICGGCRLRRRSEPVDDSAILAAFARQARAVGLRFAPAIAFCRDVAVPTVVGVLRPMILLPLSAVSGLTTEQIEVLLAHELAHIRRYDHIVNILQRLIEAVLFFHPAVWFVSRRIRIEREHCCDDLVLAVGGGRFVYAQSLVRMAELSRGGQSPPYMAAAAVALGAADRPSQLRLRILRLVSGNTSEQVRLLRPAVLGLCLFLMLAAVACVQLASRPTEDRPIEAVPPGMVGTWFFENPMGDDEQMAVFADGRIVVLYSNGHRDETRYTDGTIELAEYGNTKAKLVLLPDGRTLQTSEQAQGIAKLWQRIDATPKTELLRPLTEPPAEPAATQPASEPAWPAYDLTGRVMAPPPEIPQEIFDLLAAGKEWEECVEILCRLPSQPAANVVVTLRGKSRTLETVTNSKGEYRFTPLPDGVYEVRSQMPCPRSGRMAVATAQVGLVHYKNNIVDLSLSTDTITVRGRVTDSRANPVVGATVTAVEVQKGWVQYSEEWNPVKYSARTGTDGSYELRELPSTVFHKIPIYLARPMWGELDNIDIRVEAPGLVQNKEQVPRVALVTEEQFDEARRVAAAGEWTIPPENKDRYVPLVKGNAVTVNDIVLEAQPGTQPAPHDAAGTDQTSKIPMGQADVPEGGSRAWYLLRQRAVAPLLTELPIRLAGAQEASVLESPVWRGHPGGISVELDVRFEGKFTEDDGDLVIGFFSDPKWSQMPVRAAKITGAGRHSISGIPPGKYQIGAMIGDLAEPAAMGVHKSWPQAVEVVVGASEPIELLLSAEFNYSLGTEYKAVAKAYLPGRSVEHADRLVQGQVTDPGGKPIRHAVVIVGDVAGEPAPGKPAAVTRSAAVGTNEQGRYFCDEMDGAYTLGVGFTQSLPENFGCRWQSSSDYYTVYRGPKAADFVIDPVPSGTATLAGEVRDQDGKPLKEFVLHFRTLPEYAQPPEILKRKLKSALKLDGSDKDESDLSERLVGYRLTCLSPDGRFSFSDLPPGWYRVSPMAFDFESYENVPSQDVALANGETTTLEFVVKHKRVLYGRVLLSDGSVPPAAVRPPYKDGRILLTFREEGRSMSGDQVGFVEPDGHVRVLLTAAQHRALTRDMGFIGIDYPMVFRRDLRESDGSRHVGVYPLDQLSPDRDKAGEVRLRYPEPPDAEPAETRPAPGGDVGGRSGDLPYGTAETLGGLREPSAVEALIAALKDGDVGVRKAAAGALERSGWKPADREQRIRYLLALDKWDEAVAAGPAAKPSAQAANQAEGPFELDIPIVIALKKDDEGPGGFPRHSVVQFRVADKRLQAVLDVRFSSWPRTKWLMSVDLLDAAGKVLDQATAAHVTSGIIETFALVEPAEIRFLFDRQTDLAKAATFRFSIQCVSTDQGNPLVFDKELPLELRLSTIESSNAVEAKWIRFERNKERLLANVHVRLLSWPKARYRVRAEIPGPENRVLAHAEQVIESAGVIEGGFASTSEDTLRFDLGSTEVLEETTELVRYAVWLERVDGQTGAESQPSSAGLQGTVLLPDGKPAVGAQVVSLLAEHEARFVDGRFEREVHNRTESKPDGILAVTDADGQFNFPARPACFAVAILHDEGYVELPFARLTGSAITLRPWSRVEGVVLGLDKFKTSRPVDHLVTYRTYDRSGLGERGWQQENANINLRHSIKPDSQGRFVLERVPPGQCVIRREWVRRQADSEVHLRGGETRFEIGPGQTTRVTVGGMRRVVGRLLAAADADFQISPKNTRIRYFLEAPGFHVDSSGIDPVFSAYQEFLRSDEGKAYSGDVSPAQDGSFEIRDLPPARYFMQVRVLDLAGQEGDKDKVLGWVTSGFNLTAGVGDGNEPALDVGTIEVQPGEGSPKRDWGEAVEGVQCRLWAGRTRLKIGQSPEFAAAIRNRGNRELSVARSQQLCELQVDGRWYRWAGEIDVRSSHFPPGGEFGGISVSLGPQWQAKTDGGAKLDLPPGRHTIRVAFIAEPSGPDGGQPVRVVSNPVEIEIAGAAGDAPKVTRPAKDTSERLEELTGLASSGDRRIRKQAMIDIGKLRDRNAVPVLIKALSDPEWTVRSNAAGALGQIPDSRAVQPLSEALAKDGSTQVRISAAWALATIGGSKAVQPLVRALQDDADSVRNSVAASLNKAGWKPDDEVDKLRYLVAARKWDQAAQLAQKAKPTGTDKSRAEGSLQFDRPILVSLEALISGSGYKAETEWIEFSRDAGQLQAKLSVSFPSGPKAKWRASVDLSDATGRTLRREETTFENSGTIAGIPVGMHEMLRFSFGSVSDYAAATRFRVSLVESHDDKEPATLPEAVSSSESRPKTGVKLDFLSEIPEFHELTLTIKEDALKDLARKNNLTVQMSEDKRDRTYHLFRSDGENVIVMFAGGKCKGIQRMRKDPGFAQITLEGRWAKGRVIDGTSKKLGIEGSVYVFDPADPKLETSRPMSARSPMLDIREIEFMNRDNYPRVDVAFQFRDGQTAGGALFEMTLLDKNKEVLGTQRVLELRNREMPEEVFASAVLGGDDPPNRSGKAELYFRDVSLADVDSYRLIVSEPGLAGLMRLLDEKDTYPRESAARALGQLGSAAKPAVPKLTPFLDDPNAIFRDTARKALQRIREGKPGGAASALRVNLSLENHATGTVKITLNKTTSLRETPPGLVDVDLSAVPDGKHHIFFESPGFASQWRAVEVPLTGSPKASFDIELFRKRYVVMRCAFNVAGGRDLVGKNVEENRVAVSHWAAPKYFSEDWQVWQSSEERDGFGKTPYLRFHRQVPGFGFAEPPTDASFDDLKQAPESGYQCRDVEPEKGMVILCRVNGNRREGRGYGKILIEDITENPPQDVRVVEGREADSSRPSAPVAATRPAVSTASDSRAGGDLDLEELEELLKRGPLSYEEARRMIRPDQAHELYPMLERLTFWEKGRNLSRVIGYVTKDEQAVRALLVYAKKTGGQYAFESIGLIGGSLADNILRLAFNGKATEEMSRGWSEEESELLSGWTIPDYLAKSVKSAAATGLVLTRKPENIALVKAAYEENRVYPKDWKERGFYPADFNQMTEAMAVNAVIEEKGMEYYLNSLGHDSQTLRMVYPYVAKYLSMPPEEQEASAPASDSRSATRPAPSDVADVPVLDLNAGGNEKMRYFLIGPRPDERVSAEGYKLLVVLPGGDGGADFNPFVCRIFKNALPAGYIVAQPVAFKWTADQQIVWPTRMNKVPGQQFATEDFVEAVIKDVRSKHKLDDRHIYTLSWSSGGPAAYAVSLAENSPVRGSFVAMSVFKPDQLPSLDRAKGRAYYLYHSPDDRVCPYRMAQKAGSMLNEKAAAVTLKTYQGGHGWQGGAVYGAVRDGIKWIEKQHGDQAPSAAGGRITLFSQPSP